MYIALRPFTPATEGWRKYVEWSGLTQLKEVVSLDGILCPTVLPEIRPEYWPHIVNEDFLLNFFTDFDFLMREVAGIDEKRVLCVHPDPNGAPEAPPGFEFLGYDLMDKQCGNSALTNYGGFPEVFHGSELNEYGLIADPDRIVEIRKSLGESDWVVWAISRLTS